MRKRTINIKKDEVSGYLVENVTDPECLPFDNELMTDRQTQLGDYWIS